MISCAYSSDEWKSANARFAAYFFGNGETWEDLALVEGTDNIYGCEIPEGFTKVIFCRMNPGTKENKWDNKWNQTANLTMPTDGKNLYTVKDGWWDESDNSQWSTK